MKQLLEAGVHFGHQTRRWNPKMAEYIYCERNGIYIIDLQKTVKKLEEAYSFVRNLAENGQTILFVGTKKQAADAVKEEASRVGMYYVNARWLGGMLTNFKTMRTRIDRLAQLKKMQEDGTFDMLPKKEVMKLLGEMEAVLQKKREIAVDVEVKAPTEKTVNMSAELTAEQGWTMQEITDAATAALQAYFTGERLGEAVYTAKLASILYGVEGVKNCHLLTPSADVSVSATELPVLGTVTITEIGAGEA